MNGATRNSLTHIERLFPRFQSGKFWQQRWMNIDDSPRKRLQNRRLQNAHEPSEHHQIYFCVAQHLHELCLSVWLQPRAKLAWRKIGIRDGEFRTRLEPNAEAELVQMLRDAE